MIEPDVRKKIGEMQISMFKNPIFDRSMDRLRNSEYKTFDFGEYIQHFSHRMDHRLIQFSCPWEFKTIDFLERYQNNIVSHLTLSSDSSSHAGTLIQISPELHVVGKHCVRFANEHAYKDPYMTFGEIYIYAKSLRDAAQFASDNEDLIDGRAYSNTTFGFGGDSKSINNIGF